MARSSLVLGAVFMAVGPLIVFTPVLKFIVWKHRSPLLYNLTEISQKKETRYWAFFFFIVLLVSQVQLIAMHSSYTIFS